MLHYHAVKDQNATILSQNNNVMSSTMVTRQQCHVNKDQNA